MKKLVFILLIVLPFVLGAQNERKSYAPKYENGILTIWQWDALTGAPIQKTETPPTQNRTPRGASGATVLTGTPLNPFPKWENEVVNTNYKNWMGIVEFGGVVGSKAIKLEWWDGYPTNEAIRIDLLENLVQGKTYGLFVQYEAPSTSDGEFLIIQDGDHTAVAVDILMPGYNSIFKTFTVNKVSDLVWLKIQYAENATPITIHSARIFEVPKPSGSYKTFGGQTVESVVDYWLAVDPQSIVNGPAVSMVTDGVYLLSADGAYTITKPDGSQDSFVLDVTEPVVSAMITDYETCSGEYPYIVIPDSASFDEIKIFQDFNFKNLMSTNGAYQTEYSGEHFVKLRRGNEITRVRISNQSSYTAIDTNFVRCNNNPIFIREDFGLTDERWIEWEVQFGENSWWYSNSDVLDLTGMDMQTIRYIRVSGYKKSGEEVYCRYEYYDKSPTFDDAPTAIVSIGATCNTAQATIVNEDPSWTVNWQSSQGASTGISVTVNQPETVTLTVTSQEGCENTTFFQLVPLSEAEIYVDWSYTDNYCDQTRTYFFNRVGPIEEFVVREPLGGLSSYMIAENSITLQNNHNLGLGGHYEFVASTMGDCGSYVFTDTVNLPAIIAAEEYMVNYTCDQGILSFAHDLSWYQGISVEGTETANSLPLSGEVFVLDEGSYSIEFSICQQSWSEVISVENIYTLSVEENWLSDEKFQLQLINDTLYSDVSWQYGATTVTNSQVVIDIPRNTTQKVVLNANANNCKRQKSLSITNRYYQDSISWIDTSFVAIYDYITVTDTTMVNDTITIYENVVINDTIAVYKYVTVYDSTCIDSSFYIDGIEVPKVSDFTTYPNPFQDFVTFDFGEDFAYEIDKIQIYDLVGRLIVNKAGVYKKKYTWAPQEWQEVAGGMYLVKITTTAPDQSSLFGGPTNVHLGKVVYKK